MLISSGRKKLEFRISRADVKHFSSPFTFNLEARDPEPIFFLFYMKDKTYFDFYSATGSLTSKIGNVVLLSNRRSVLQVGSPVPVYQDQLSLVTVYCIQISLSFTSQYVVNKYGKYVYALLWEMRTSLIGPVVAQAYSVT